MGETSALGGAWRLLNEFLRPDTGEDRSVPVLDRGLMPNDAIDGFDEVWRSSNRVDAGPGPGPLLSAAGSLVVCDGSRVHVLPDLEVSDTASRGRSIDLGSTVGALAADESGVWAVLTNGRAALLDLAASDAIVVKREFSTGVHCPTDAAMLDGRLYVSGGSATLRPDQWSSDLMGKGADGRVFEFEPASGSKREVAHGLRWASGVAGLDDGHLLISEAWAPRIVDLNLSSGAMSPVSDRLPGYPGRLSRTVGGKVLIAFPLMRTQLIELILRDDRFRDRMVREVPPAFWMAPSLRSTGQSWEPTQIGAAKHLGITRPWAPPRVYGLAARMHPDGDFEASWHARGGSKRSGITAVIEHRDRLVLACAGEWSVLLGPEASVQ